MAAKETANLEERVYTIPLRSAWLKVPRKKRCKKAVNTIKKFLEKHMHTTDVKLSPELNKSLWCRGIEKPPGKIKVKVRREKEFVFARLPTEKVEAEKKEEKKGLKDRLVQKAEASKKLMSGPKT